ncbi:MULTISPECIES: TIGR03854 family LLM class F420-dependent oxidoreductase [unclassified Mycolicibacterium]|uniref:TIGR03854 family LLM class F420-dependent oxidoreductase n=1 Tax=unclassified Mycolicibacterium TaxID=2636767 RepID=UPI0012DCE8FE|nr:MULTISPECIES: TIGR03854 family LLM class F420-dependent oxidoreductase [unclassified Mycolicibacterium]MUL85526.1 TIGR03854 family LLM class F420-dependent oxidoreductase [Mycolicibacterium sp. CBMA 329]MUL88710.1 TIGR03854 family LLM class F420-dependent oxidoreductase [Mycolicibacterium sp. CBMA 331]MUM01996.1 TIGR03854 family LLM class F420-dependent oxidoreductase [Mycolicibacterium sp. CBMA 334]MUM26902.1 TIGR03854 family LLM class F420-dependent oxidoreductase [Mycolicibacterium sp. CB
MKVRFGVGVGADTSPEELGGIVENLESSGVDSLWFSELVYTPAVDPFIGMAYALARTKRLKVGTSVAILPGRHPVLVAKQLASLAALAPKRVLPVFGLHSALPAERDIFVVPDGRRTAVFDESLHLLRSALRGDDVSFEGEYFAVRSASVQPLPAAPLDIWLGGSAPAALTRIGRLGDGWLGSLLTPDEAAAARRRIEAEAAAAGRTIEPDHYGISLAVGDGAIPADVLAAVRRRRPDVDPADLVAADWADLHRQLDRYLAAGLSKFVIRAVGPADRGAFLDRFTAELLPRQN